MIGGWEGGLVTANSLLAGFDVVGVLAVDGDGTPLGTFFGMSTGASSGDLRFLTSVTESRARQLGRT